MPQTPRHPGTGHRAAASAVHSLLHHLGQPAAIAAALLIAAPCMADPSRVELLAAIGCEGAIVGKALYESAFTLPDALAAVS